MSVKIKGQIGIGIHDANHKYEYTLGELGFTEDDWYDMSTKEKDEFFNQLLEDELSNVLDASFWEESEEDVDE